MLITSWSLLNQEDYWEKGITIEDLGLEDMNADEILAHVED
jgi:hypothetical protein